MLRKISGWYEQDKEVVLFKGIINISESGKFAGSLIEESQYKEKASKLQAF